MSTTTQILFNSPALHSLRRDQLVKLCKIHSVKANGKNVDLIERLKQHATQLPKDSPLSVAARSDGEEDGAEDGEDEDQVKDEDKENEVPAGRGMPRPSEQWEIVMESIQEMEESSSMGTLVSSRTTGSNGSIPNEFGTGGTKTANSVSSSIKAFATSLGLKRNNTAKSNISASSTSQFSVPLPLQMPFAPNGAAPSDLAQHSVPYAALPPTTPGSMPQTDPCSFSTPDFHPTTDADNSISMPIPGNTHRPGVPAPPNARLSLGTGGGTTIRLVNVPSAFGYGDNGTPKLKAFKTSFDLVAGSPAVDGSTFAGAAWPPVSPIQEAKDVEMDANMLKPPAFNFGSTTPPRPSLKSSALPSPEPFIFGSPLPQHKVSNTQFRIAAAEVMEEMNKRLAEAGVKPVETDLLTKRGNLSSHSDATGGDGARGDDKSKRGGAKDKFDKMHEEQFKKMDSIEGHWAVTRGTPDKATVRVRAKRKSSVLGHGNGPRSKPRGSMMGRGPAPASRRVSGGVRRASGARVISNGTRKKMGIVPGGFVDEEANDEESEDDDEAKRKRVRTDTQCETEAGKGEEREKVVTIVPPPLDLQEEEKKLKEREAIRRKLDQNKARRRSSMGRPSLVPPQKAKGMVSRFGFLSSAKSMVQNVFKGVGTAKASTSGIPTSKPPTVVAEPKKLGNMGPPPLKKPVVSTAKSSTMSRAPSVSRSLKPPAVTGPATASRVVSTSGTRSRSPIPSFGSTATRSSSSTVSTRTGSSSIGTASSRAASSRVGSRNGSTAGVSSTLTTSRSRVSSMGTRASLASVASGSVGSSGAKSTGTGTKSSISETKTRARTSSRLMAPTASSLARSGSGIRSPNSTSPHEPVVTLPSVGEEERISTDKTQAALESITNSPVNGAHGPLSPQLDNTVSKPLVSASPLQGTEEELEGEEAENLVVAAKPTRVPSVGRKPRISRSKVIAKLVSQRATTGKSSSSSSSRPRSSLGAAKSGKAGRTSAGGGVAMSAKKKARQSEYARRRSRAAAVGDSGVGNMVIEE